MKKFAILFALLASVGLARAEVSMFGTMDVGFSDVKAPGSTSSQTAFTSGGMTTSNIGFQGKENLGKGTSAVFELSSFVNVGNGALLGGSTVNTFARSSFVGLSNNAMGTVTLGRQINPSFLPTVLFNAYGDSSAYSPLWHATYFGRTGNPTTQIFNDTAWDNSVAFKSPTVGGATVTAMVSKGTGGNNSGVNVLYFKGDLGLTAYTQRTEVNSSGSFQNNIFTANKPATATGFGASYDLKVAKVFATWQEGKDSSLNMDGKTTQVSALIPMGRGNVMAEYATSRSVVGATATKYNEWALGYDYNLSKKADLYVTAGRTSVTHLADGSSVGAGLRLRF